MNFKELDQKQRATRGGGSRRNNFTAFVKVTGYEPAEAVDMKAWNGRGHKDDRMVVSLMHDIPGLACVDDNGQAVTVKVRLVDHENTRKHNVLDMAKGRENKPAMTPRNEPIMRVEGTFNPSTGEIEATWMNRIHAKMDPAGATAYVGNFMSVSRESREKKREDGTPYTTQSRHVALPEQALPLSMFGADTETVKKYLEDLGGFEPEAIKAICDAQDDFRSGDRTRVVAALRQMLTMSFESVNGLPGVANVCIRGMDANAAGGTHRIWRNQDADNNWEPVSIEKAVEDGLADPKTQPIIDFATAHPSAYWDVFPLMQLRTGANNLPSNRVANDKKEGRDVKDVMEYSDHRFFRTMTAPNDEGKSFITVGFSKAVMGVGRNTDVDVETSERTYTGGFYGMGVNQIVPFSTNYSLDILPTDFMDPATLKVVNDVAESRQKEFVQILKDEKKAKNMEDAAPEPDNNDATPEPKQVGTQQYGMG